MKAVISRTSLEGLIYIIRNARKCVVGATITMIVLEPRKWATTSRKGPVYSAGKRMLIEENADIQFP